MNRNHDTISAGVTPGIITELRQTKTQDTDTESGEQYFAPFGVDDENVQIYIKTLDENDNYIFTEWGTLRDFFQEWVNFKNTWNDFITNGKFMQYSSTEPISDSVKLLFEIKGD